MRARLNGWRAIALVLALAAAGTGAGCAYFNTYYTAQRNFREAEEQMALLPDPEVTASAGMAGQYDKAIQGATKILLEYPTSKWVDDALLLIGRSMLAKGDFPAAQEKFTELAANFPTSELRDQAVFWSAVAAERDRRRPEAIAGYDSLLTHWPNSKQRDQAMLRRANLYLLARQPARAEPDLRELASRKGQIGYEAGLKLAEALFAARRFAEARSEFVRVAEQAPTEQLRTDARLRVGDCDEALSDYEAATQTYLTLLREARTDDGRARARLRYASALGMAGRVDAGLEELANVIEDQPRTPYAAEAAFRSGYLHEVVRDDFTAAREAYDGVAQQLPSSPFVAQAAQRRENLEDLQSFRAANADSDSVGNDAGAEAAFRSAELYLFQLGKPEKAIEEYERLAREFPNSPLVPRAAFARGWVKSRRLGDAEGARKEFEAVIAGWPASDVAERARHLLEQPADSTFAHDALPPASVEFPLVPGHAPYVPPPPASSGRPATPRPAAGTPAAAGKAPVDSAAAAAARAAQVNLSRRDSLRARIDSINAAAGGAPRDTSGRLEP